MLKTNIFMTEEKRKTVRDIIIADIKKHVDVAVIGLSGGADSTLVASLCVLALGKENVYGFSMPYNKIDTATFNSRSERLAKTLGINHEVLPINLAVDAFKQQFGGMSTLNQGNLRSRMRMLNLYAQACKIGETVGGRVRVMGTGNLSEDFIGYDTKGGDALADIFPIGELYKRDVYNMLDDLVGMGVITDDLIDRVPSAGLWDGQTDEGELGHTYDEMAPAIEFLRNNYNMLNDVTTLEDFVVTLDICDYPDKVDAGDADDEEKRILWFVWERHFKNRHKHLAPYVTNLNR